MRAVVQRVKAARVEVDRRVAGQIDAGLLVFLAIAKSDTRRDAEYMADKLTGLRIFADEAGRMNRSVLDTGLALLVVSQFTLYADTRKGRRPSLTDAAPPDIARPLVDRFVELLVDQGVTTLTGEFGAHMLVEIANDGPVTIILEK